MRRNNAKKLATLLAAAIMVTTLAGCSSLDGATASANGDSSTTEESTATAATTAATTATEATVTDDTTTDDATAAESTAEATEATEEVVLVAELDDEVREAMVALSLNNVDLDSVWDAFGQVIWRFNYNSMAAGPKLDSNGDPERDKDGNIRYIRITPDRIKSAKEKGLTDHVISDALSFAFETEPDEHEGWNETQLEAARWELYDEIHGNEVVARAYAEFIANIMLTNTFGLADIAGNEAIAEFNELNQKAASMTVEIEENGKKYTVRGNELWAFTGENDIVYLTNGQQEGRDEKLADWDNYQQYADAICLLLDYFELSAPEKRWVPAYYHYAHNCETRGSLIAPVLADYSEYEPCFIWRWRDKAGTVRIEFGSNQLDKRPVLFKDFVRTSTPQPTSSVTPPKPPTGGGGGGGTPPTPPETPPGRKKDMLESPVNNGVPYFGDNDPDTIPQDKPEIKDPAEENDVDPKDVTPKTPDPDEKTDGTDENKTDYGTTPVSDSSYTNPNTGETINYGEGSDKDNSGSGASTLPPIKADDD